MREKSTTRPIVCLLLVLSLSAVFVRSAAPMADRDSGTELRGLAAPAPAILLSRAGTRHDDARQRQSAPSLFTLVPLHGGASDPGRLTAAVDHSAPRSLWTAGPRTGRSPPPIS